jgi:hypothetical protein
MRNAPVGCKLSYAAKTLYALFALTLTKQCITEFAMGFRKVRMHFDDSPQVFLGSRMLLLPIQNRTEQAARFGIVRVIVERAATYFFRKLRVTALEITKSALERRFHAGDVVRVQCLIH